jgi:hypothetical protein
MEYDKKYILPKPAVHEDPNQAVCTLRSMARILVHRKEDESLTPREF